MAPTTSNGGTQLSSIALSNALMNKLKPAKIYKGAVEPLPPPTPGSYTRSNAGPRHITGISFDDRGDQILTAA
ncbi:hypothetical protein SERLA73DRAFT_137243, partial [Serpula lacrymans var. lacrymans S7.3]